jgi:8-oxo-dGTP pyrophosphatase MutT (NUDIX family)
MLRHGKNGWTTGWRTPQGNKGSDVLGMFKLKGEAPQKYREEVKVIGIEASKQMMDKLREMVIRERETLEKGQVVEGKLKEVEEEDKNKEMGDEAEGLNVAGKASGASVEFGGSPEALVAGLEIKCYRGPVMRKRATGIVTGEGRVLLVRDIGSDKYSLPGGGLSEADRYLYTSKGWHQQDAAYVLHGVYRYSTMLAVIRELREETGLQASEAKFLFHHTTPYRSVYLIENPRGEVRLQLEEVDAFVWWDGKSVLPLWDSARDILQRYGFPKHNLISRYLRPLGA